MSAEGRGRDPAAQLERQLLERLGLEPDATPEQIEAAHAAVSDYLSGAPRRLRGWARGQAAAADEAYVLLTDPMALAEAASVAADPAPGRARAAEAPQPEPRVSSRRKAARAAAAPATTEALGADADDEIDELIAEVTPSAHRDEVRIPRPRARAAGLGRPGGVRGIPRIALAIAAVAAVAVIAVVVYQLGQPATTAATDPTAAASATPALDEAQVAALMARVQADPKDTEALMDLGDAFFQAAQYDVAATWLAKLVALEPENVRALLALGAADFNSGDATEAEQCWLKVVDLDASNVEAHYDLGFLYLQQQPPDLDSVQREWKKVVELAPGTEVAQSVQAHLDALASASPAASGSPSPAASASPAASTSPSPAPAP